MAKCDEMKASTRSATYNMTCWGTKRILLEKKSLPACCDDCSGCLRTDPDPGASSFRQLFGPVVVGPIKAEMAAKAELQDLGLGKPTNKRNQI
jgi:hypothetical protein